MKLIQNYGNYRVIRLIVLGLLVGLAACGQSGPEQAAEHVEEDGVLVLPEVDAVDLNGRSLRIVATTSIIGDVVAQVGGDAIDLTTLIGPGQDPHSYEPSANDLTRVELADVVFVNGWDLEESLVNSLAAIGGQTPLAPISANIEPHGFAADDHAEENEEDDEHGHGGADPHVWFAVPNVKQWTANVQQILSDLDPAQADVYAANAAAYLAELDELQADTEAQLAAIPAEKRLLVTNHDSFGYFADEYEFKIVGAVIPGVSTLAEPSASDLAELIAVMSENDICTIFTETTLSDRLAQTVADELSSCDEVHVIPLYTGSVGSPGSGADSYIGMFQANVEAIIAGLQ